MPLFFRLKNYYTERNNMHVLSKILLLTVMGTGIHYTPAGAQDAISENGLQVMHDLEYKEQAAGSAPVLKLDVYRSSQNPPKMRPAILFVHGGGFWEGDKSSSLYVKMATAFALNGYVSVSVNYTLKKETEPYSRSILERDISDVLAALHWVRENSTRLRIDISKLIICGDSAGGGIVINLSYDPVNNKYFAGCIDLWGGLPGDRGWNAPVFPGHLTRETPATCILHGTTDRIVPFQTSQALGLKLKTAGIPYELHPLKDANHYPVQLADQFIPVLIAFANKVLHRK
ncbi:MAG TPA: alpha/beta hydrolase [Puia sp.]|nr:alpha/beta hydrolase [Puia sp.]